MSFSELGSNFPDHCLVRKCQRDGCGLLLNPKSINKILDLDHVVLNLANHTRCDFLIFTKKNKRVYVVPVELKSGGVSNAKGVVDQLQGGVEQANRWLEKGVDFDLIPI
ncbi:MAG: hypothetical protein F4073_00610, partial [Rhodobacteraceae bacterium]|nr:hypothetical protein [Paracoccaceae bacterium]